MGLVVAFSGKAIPQLAQDTVMHTHRDVVAIKARCVMLQLQDFVFSTVWHPNYVLQAAGEQQARLQLAQKKIG